MQGYYINLFQRKDVGFKILLKIKYLILLFIDDTEYRSDICAI